MVTNLIIDGNIGFFATNKQFVLIIKGNIHGPFRNKDYKKVIEFLRTGGY